MTSPHDVIHRGDSAPRGGTQARGAPTRQCTQARSAPHNGVGARFVRGVARLVHRHHFYNPAANRSITKSEWLGGCRCRPVGLTCVPLSTRSLSPLRSDDVCARGLIDNIFGSENYLSCVQDCSTSAHPLCLSLSGLAFSFSCSLKSST